VNRRIGAGAIGLLTIVALLAMPAVASDAQMYFSSDKNGQNRVTNIQEGDEVFIVVIDNDQNIDCDVRDKMGPDIKIMDPKTGAYIVWQPNDDADWLNEDFLEETGADTGVFVSHRAFQVGTRESYSAADPWQHTHVVDRPTTDGVTWATDDFRWGHFLYADDPADNPAGDLHADDRGWLVGSDDPGQPTFTVGWGTGNIPHVPSEWHWAPGTGAPPAGSTYMIGRFENMDTLVGLYIDPNDATDIAIALMKIIDTEATLSWDQEVYKDGNGAATITVVDPDENLNCNEIESVPVFILVNPGSWNPVQTGSPTSFCALLRTGGVAPNLRAWYPAGVTAVGNPFWLPIRWYNIYHSVTHDSLYYVQYDINQFRTTAGNGITPVLFYAWETGTDTGVFQLNLNSILDDLFFDELRVRDVLVAYYLDPNDFDDLKLATAYIEERQHSVASFTDATRADQELYWIGRDAVYVQVIDANANVDPCCPEQVVVHICDPHGEDDAEWLILDETSSNSPVFFTNAGSQLWPVWDALGVGLQGSNGGFQLQLDNWKLEAFNEDSIYVRYNDVYYVTGVTGMAGLGDITSASPANTAFPPAIDRVRVANDVSFDLMEVADTQVYDGTAVNMYFLDRQGNRVSGYVNSDCVFVEVIDPDQDEDQHRRERIDGFWDGAQNFPFGPVAHDLWEDCGPPGHGHHDVNDHLGHTVLFGDQGWAKLYVLNPRNGFWAAVDLLETGVATGDFVSVICIDLVGVYECAPTLRVLPGDTIIAVYQDPSNHSDIAWISIKAGIGGGGSPTGTGSTTAFVDADGAHVENYAEGDPVYVLVTDPSQPTGMELSGLTVDGQAATLHPMEGSPGVFITDGLDLDLSGGQTLTATYVDPADPTDTSSDTITVIASELDIASFYAGPSPFDDEVTFGFIGTGVATTMEVVIYDASGHVVWAEELANVTEIVWDGTDEAGNLLANGAYIYVITATDGTNTFTGKDLVFVNR